MGSVTCRGGEIRDESVTIVTNFPFTGGSLSGGRDLLVRHADFLLQPQFSIYEEILRVDRRLCYVVGTGQISKSVDKRVARKLWVVHWVIQYCTSVLPKTQKSGQSREVFPGSRDKGPLAVALPELRKGIHRLELFTVRCS